MQTKNLDLVPHTPRHLLALLDGTAQYERSFGLPVADGLREFMVSDEVSPDWLARLRVASEADPWTFGYAVVYVASQTVIGTCSFKGPPGADGIVEIAYGIAPGHQGRGYATEAAQALVTYAFDSGRVRLVLAHTAPEPNASTKVLAKCGFTYVGEVIDPEDGLVWRWEKFPSAA